MRLVRLNVAGFGRLAGCDVAFAPGVNVIVGPNEAGKTTLQQALVAALYGLYQGEGTRALREGDARWQRFKPWDGPSFAVSLELRLDDGRRFRLSRDFAQRRATRTVIVELDTGRTVTADYAQGRHGYVGFGEQHLGLGALAFQGSASVAQGDLGLGDAAPGLAEELARVVASAGSASTAMALAHLQEGLRQIGAGPAARVTPHARLRAQVQELEKEREQGIARRAEHGAAVERRLAVGAELEEAACCLGTLRRRQVVALQRLAAERETRALALGLAALRDSPPHLQERAGALQRLADEVERSRAAFEAAQEIERATREQGASPPRQQPVTPWLPIVVAALVVAGLLAALKAPLPLAALAGLVVGLAVLTAERLRQGHAARQSATNPDSADASAEPVTQAAERLAAADAGLRRLLEEVGQELAAWMAISGAGSAEAAGLGDEVLDGAIKEQEERIARLREEAARLDGGLGVALGELREQADVEEELERARAALARLDEQHAALELAVTELSAAQEAVHRDFAPRLAALVAPPFHRLTGGRYEQVFVDPAGLALRVQPAGHAEPVVLSHVSRGTGDQALLLLRLAVLALLTEGRERVPLFLDEPFAHCDAERRRTLLRTLIEAPFVGQTVLFTCDEALVCEVAGGAAVHRLVAGAPQPP